MIQTGKFDTYSLRRKAGKKTYFLNTLKGNFDTDSRFIFIDILYRLLCVEQLYISIENVLIHLDSQTGNGN